MHLLFLILHILGAGVLIGVVVFSVILNIQGTLTSERLKIFQIIRNTGTYAAVVMVITGLVLYFQEPEEFKDNILFWVKIGLFVLDGIIAVLIIDRKVKNAIADQTGKSKSTSNMTIWVLVNLVIIFTIVALGVLIVEH